MLQASYRPPDPDPPRERERSELRISAGECMRCHGDSRVIDTNDAPGSIRRRRQCLECGWRWTTYERVEP